MAGLKGVPQRPHFVPPPREDDSWKAKGACRGTDPEAFFPERGSVITAGARRICNSCEVQGVCLEYALSHGEWYGIWGGLSVNQRRELLRRPRTKRTARA